MPQSQLPKTDDLQFGDVVIDRASFTVLRSGQKCELTPRAFDVLVYLVQNHGRVVEKQELFEQVWGERFVTDNSLMRAIREIRRGLGDNAAAPRYIETIHKRGYRFIADLETGPDPEPETPSEMLGLEEPILGTPRNDEGANSEGLRSGSISLSRTVALGVAFAALVAVTTFAIYYVWSERPIRSIAVLPLENAGSGADVGHMGDGIAESVINSLSELPEIKVVARATAFRFRGQEFDPQKIRRELGVDAILTGRIVQTVDDLTVQADLIDASDGSQIWGSRYSLSPAAAYELPGAIAIDVAKKLELNLTAEQAKRLTKNYTENPEAFRLFSLGRFFWNKRSEDALNKSIDYFEQAIATDPNYALAYAGLADSYAVMAISADMPAHDVFPKAKAAAARALELDDSLVEAHATMLRIKAQYEWDWAGAEQQYRRAIELNPGYAMTHIYYLSYLVSAGRADEAVFSVRRAQELDPLSLVANAVVARALFFAGRYDEAIAQSQKTLEMDENVMLARLMLGRSYARQGMFDAAIAELEKARRLPGTNSESTSLLAHTLAVTGRTTEARKLLDEMKQLSTSRYVQPYDIAIVYAGLDDKEAAFEWLEKAYQDRNHQVPLINAVPEFANLRSDPRFASLSQRIEGSR